MYTIRCKRNQDEGFQNSRVSFPFRALTYQTIANVACPIVKQSKCESKKYFIAVGDKYYELHYILFFFSILFSFPLFKNLLDTINISIIYLERFTEIVLQLQDICLSLLMDQIRNGVFTVVIGFGPQRHVLLL